MKARYRNPFVPPRPTPASARATIPAIAAIVATGLAANLAASPAPATALDCAVAERPPAVQCSPVVTVVAESSIEPAGAAAGPVADTLWRLWVDLDRLWIQRAPAPGKRYSTPQAVNAKSEPISTGAENRPRLMVAGDELTVVWSRPGRARFTADVRMAASTDRGRSFTAPQTFNHDGLEIGHSFADLVPDIDGQPLVVWLDGRDRHAADARGQEFTGSSLYWRRADPGANARPAAAGTCECCRLATARLTDGRPLVMWRHIFPGGERDHALGLFDGEKFQWKRVSFEHWRIDGCPHHGPALAVDRSGGIHAAWFSGAAPAPGVYYRRFESEWLASGGGDPDPAGAGRIGTPPPIGVGNPEHLPSHPAVATAGDLVVLAWREFDGHRQRIRAQYSTDRGLSWTSARTLASHAGPVDHPALLVLQGRVWLSWHVPGQGHRLLPLEAM